MDPLTFVLTVYMQLLISTDAERFSIPSKPSQQQLQLIDDGVYIDFSLNSSEINNVCAQHHQRLLNYAQCTIKAKVAFKKLCHFLTEHKRAAKAYQKLYCQASEHYKPMPVELTVIQEQDFMMEAKQRCNAAISRTMRSTSISDKKDRNKACTDYRLLKMESLPI